MRIFVENMNIKYISTNKLTPYISHQEKRCLIYSEEGIFKVLPNKLLKLRVIDSPISKINIDNRIFLVDKSKYEVDDEYYQIQPEHYYEEVNVITHELRSKSRIKLMVELNDGKIQDLYFTTKENIHTIGIKDDINTFLSLLKFNNNI